MLDIGEYIIDEPYQQYGNGYDQLQGEWATYYKIATKFVYRARFEDRDDMLHTIMLNLAVAGRNDGHKPDNPSWMYRIASFTVAQYWHNYYYRTNGIDCGHCSNPQRKKCKAENLYGSKCPRAIKIESLQKPITDGDGHLTELGELIADDRAIDLEAWLNEATWRLGYPQRLVDIAQKINEGEALTNREHQYLWQFRQKDQKRLF